MLGLITGSGFYDIAPLQARREERVETPYGAVPVTHARWQGEYELIAIARHGSDHSIAPHLINYRANLAALRSAGVTAILATAVSGGITPGLNPGDLVVIDDFLDFTSGRPGTFFDAPGAVRHTDMTDAYDPQLRGLIVESAISVDVDVAAGGTYCTFNGPRFETPAEIRMAAMLGGDLVGMTGYPEVVLARELGIAYASIGVISNRAAGMGAGRTSLDEIMETLKIASEPLYRLIGAAIERFYSARDEDEYRTARMFVGEEHSTWALFPDRSADGESP